MTLSGLTTGHVGLNVTDLQRSRDFYTRAFDFEVLGESHEPDRGYVFLGLSGTLVLTLWQQGREGFSPSVAGLHHLSFQVESIDAVREMEGRLSDLSVTFAYEGVVPHGEGAGSGGVFFYDPDGIRLEVYAPSGAEGGTTPIPAAPTCGFF
ncbi:VOC family protein [Spiractinospora alimapuensis]|uniref:VOC family protein n=1 Tax=Spiractinospora alimapuensis TaxID=2820884 RepID=UPI001F1D4381|nr:VOC family protein [Spiractinospora alimapuensis]QVQ51801.1 VOC family protein [Spiractinospora alimapuensis]